MGEIRATNHQNMVDDSVPKMISIIPRLEKETHTKTTTGWWLSPTPLKNHGVRQLG